MNIPTIEEMFALGMHFGHKRERSHPMAKQYTYVLKNKIYVINLEKTQKKLAEALDFLTKVAKEDKVILFVGSKRQARETVGKYAALCEMPYVNYRWLGGTLTNFETIQKNLKTLTDLESQKQSEEYKAMLKKEKKHFDEKLAKFEKSFGGLKTLKNLPDCLFIVDAAEESNAVCEARKRNIPIVAICDTNSNPELIDWPIPANDDAEKSIELIVSLASQAIKEGKKNIKPVKKEEDKDAKKD